MKVVFLGTPDFAIPSLEALISTSWIELIAVCTQTDKPKGRGKHLTEPPVKTLALKNNLPLFQTRRIAKEPEVISKLKELHPDVMVSCSYGQILSQEILDIAPVINVHASLLPKYRGAAPINWAIVNGEKETGITTMQTELSLDSGPIVLQEKCEITENETSFELYTKLSVLGASTLIKTLEKIKDESATYTTQDDTQATLAPMLKKEMGLINWGKTTQEIHNQIRGLQPWPSAYTHISGKTVKIWESRVGQQTTDSRQRTADKRQQTADKRQQTADSGQQITDMSVVRGQLSKAGTIVELGEVVKVKTGDGYLNIFKVQPENKKIINAKDWVNGARVQVGDVFN